MNIIFDMDGFMPGTGSVFVKAWAGTSRRTEI